MHCKLLIFFNKVVVVVVFRLSISRRSRGLFEGFYIELYIKTEFKRIREDFCGFTEDS